MPVRTVPDTDFEYHLVLFDEDGNERKEHDGSLHSKDLVENQVEGVTDVFVISHGWKGDIPAAIRQYDHWVGAMARQDRDVQRMRDRVPGFRPLVVCVHWPSLPWGVEEVGAALLSGDSDDQPAQSDDLDEFATEQELDLAGLVNLYAPRIGDSEETRRALTTIIRAAEEPEVAETAAETGELPDPLAAAYRTLFAQAELGDEGAVGPPNAEQGTFEPGKTIEVWADRDDAPPAPAVLGLDDLAARVRNARDVLLGPVRQVSFWTMKKRALAVGQSGVHDLVHALQQATADDTRLHLMGHSFGCIVVSAAVAGPRGAAGFSSPLPRPVDAVFLVQGAMSLWSFADQVSFSGGQPGYFSELVQPERIQGPLVTTQSSFDTAVGKYYPLGARAGGDVLLDGALPKYGGIGSWGAQGAGATPSQILASNSEYGLRQRARVNVDADRVICNGTGPSGAHSDISHDDVAHLMWQAVLGSLVPA